MARIVDNTNTLTAPAWAGDYFNREHMIPGGARLDAAQFTDTVPSGTVVGRTLAERDAGDAYGPAGDTDDEIYVVCFDVYDVAINPDVELYRPNSILKENFLPDIGTLSAAVLAALRATYVCTRGVQ